MHGIAKVKRSHEEDEAKKAETQKKLQLYVSAVARIFKKRAAGELDDEARGLTAEILLKNPDFNTLWNYRREVLLHFQAVRSNEEMQAVFDHELAFTEACLKVSPKTYGTWQHRVWILSSSSNPNWERELKLTTLFLQLDERNFHCWDYRRFVAARAAASPADELEFTSKKISTNFSNYSAWHYRSKLLPQVRSDSRGPNGIAAKAFCAESELVQNAVFTDPNDQSAWFYHRWLLGRLDQKLTLSCLYVSKPEKLLSATFTKQVCKNLLVLTVNSTEVHAEWRSPDGYPYSYIWSTTYPLSDGDSISVELRGSESVGAMLHVNCDQDDLWTIDHNSHVPLLSGLCKLPVASLKEDLSYCLELHALEPKNKWVLLTLVLLMKTVDFGSYKDKVLEKLDELIAVDSYRQRYYWDLRSQILLDDAAEKHQGLHRLMSLQHLRLTRLCHMERFFALHVLDVSKNNLESLVGINHIPSLRKLFASDNCITTCTGLTNMHCLRELYLDNNNICDISHLEDLKTCHRLDTVRLQGNGKISDLEDVIRKLLPHLQSIVL